MKWSEIVSFIAITATITLASCSDKEPKHETPVDPHGDEGIRIRQIISTEGYEGSISSPEYASRIRQLISDQGDGNVFTYPLIEITDDLSFTIEKVDYELDSLKRYTETDMFDKFIDHVENGDDYQISRVLSRSRNDTVYVLNYILKRGNTNFQIVAQEAIIDLEQAQTIIAFAKTYQLK